MAVSAAIGLGTAAIGGQAYAAKRGRDQRKKAEAQSALEREALAEAMAEPEPVMPLPDDEAARRARRRSIAGQMRRRGRASTILTDSTIGDPLGS